MKTAAAAKPLFAITANLVGGTSVYSWIPFGKIRSRASFRVLYSSAGMNEARIERNNVDTKVR